LCEKRRLAFGVAVVAAADAVICQFRHRITQRASDKMMIIIIIIFIIKMGSLAVIITYTCIHYYNIIINGIAWFRKFECQVGKPERPPVSGLINRPFGRGTRGLQQQLMS